MKRVVRIGSRRSQLSLWQANHIAGLIRRLHPGVGVEIVEYSTRGDLDQSSPLPAIGGKGLFTEALEKALRQGEIDCAVHSLKDLPVDIVADLAIVAVPKRGDHRDVLVSPSGATLADLPIGARIATGSLRRRAQLLALRPDLKLLPIRGNVPTRLDKLLAADSDYDAIVLAAAGLQRLGLAEHISEVFADERLLSAAGQGALAVQCRNDRDSLAFFAGLNDPESALTTAAERAFLGALAGGCSVPIGAYAYMSANTLHLAGRVLSADGAQQINVSGETPAADGPRGKTSALELASQLAEQALESGARDLLDDLETDDQR